MKTLKEEEKKGKGRRVMGIGSKWASKVPGVISDCLQIGDSESAEWKYTGTYNSNLGDPLG